MDCGFDICFYYNYEDLKISFYVYSFLCQSNHIRNPHIFHNTAVFLPILSVFGLAALIVSIVTMENHNGEENRVIEGKDSGKTTTQPPNRGHHNICRIMDFTSILPPPIREKIAPTFSF
jgi:hypothetical protein